MSFEGNLGGVRTRGREMVLPVDQIKKLLKDDLFDKCRHLDSNFHLTSRI